MLFVVVVLEEEVVLEQPAVVLAQFVGLIAMDALCPGRMPRSRRRSVRACKTSSWMTTSGLALSMSLMILLARAILSGVSRMTMAFWALTWVMRLRSRSWRRPVVISV